MRTLRLLTVLLLLPASAAAADVVVLRGGNVIELKSPVVRRGNTALLTRADGTLLSVPVSEIDATATAAARAVPAASAQGPALAAPPATPAEAARASRERPKARVRLTDADVGHEYVGPAASEQKKETLAGGGAGRLEIGDYTQEKAEGQLLVRGTLRNAGGTAATLSRMTVSALNEKGETIASAEASVAGGAIAPSQSTGFTASLAVGEQTAVSLRFAPRWVAAPLPASAGARGGASQAGESGEKPDAGSAAAVAASRAAAAPPAAQPVPPGQGVLYAAPPPSASFSPPADGKSGYIPGAAHPENQPKPPQ